tara:strand:+ start:154 stop:378 length:225 start_codon:yes stop_codon:yes gene_type:complete
MEYKFTNDEKKMLNSIISSFCDVHFYPLDSLEMTKEDWENYMGWGDDKKQVKAFKSLYRKFGGYNNAKLFEKDK